MNTVTTPISTTGLPENMRRRRGVGFWVGRALLGLVLALAALAVSGATYQAIGTELDRRAFVPSGRMVDIGGHQMHLQCTGQGSPTVVLETGSGAPGAIWARVQPEAAQHTRVCAYDRAGLGWSEPSPNPRDAGSIAQELHALLAHAGERGPFVLVSHSLGGQYALMFAHRYREETVGLVLVDAQHPDTLFRTPEAQAIYQQQQQQATLPGILSRLGIVRLLNLFPADPRLPADAQSTLNIAKNRTGLATALQAELLAIPTSREQLQAAGDLGDLPLAVVSATEHGMSPEMEDYWLGLQRELTALSSNSRHDIVAGADHSSLITEQHDAQRTLAAIRDIVTLASGAK